jgi:hypothetical protein
MVMSEEKKKEGRLGELADKIKEDVEKGTKILEGQPGIRIVETKPAPNPADLRPILPLDKGPAPTSNDFPVKPQYRKIGKNGLPTT